MDNYSEVKKAILEKLTIVAIYDGLRRELCPHALGHKKGVPRALFYQCGGDTSKGPVLKGSPANWRCLDLAKLQILETTKGAWSEAGPHTKASSCLDLIDFAVSV